MSGSADRFRPLQALAGDECRRVRDLVGRHAVFSLYLESGLEAVAGGDRSRSFLLGRAGAGVALAIEFDDVSVRTVIGHLDDDELAAACAVGRRAELHVAPDMRGAVTALCEGRVLADQTIRYFGRPVGPGGVADPRCRRLAAGDYPTATSLFRAHHPATIFSRWMLDETLIGLFEAGELVACGGVVVRHRGLAAANLGNFLTVPARRGEGLARVVMATLLASLAADGITLATLGATAENRAACRSYEAMGFTLIEERAELVVGPG